MAGAAAGVLSTAGAVVSKLGGESATTPWRDTVLGGMHPTPSNEARQASQDAASANFVSSIDPTATLTGLFTHRGSATSGGAPLTPSSAGGGVGGVVASVVSTIPRALLWAGAALILIVLFFRE